ncbi:MAG: sigma-70 family RNA polymerase sigma factor [Acidobacteria bacterium]|nr:sigma-70 family RNA polymerase sigma factor [Acidobacteriota bacterium]
MTTIGVAVEDDELIGAAQAGSVDAFSELVRRYQRAVRTCLAARMSDAHEAEDLAQEVFVTAFERLRQFDRTRPLGPWLRGIAINLLRNHRRKFRPEYIGGCEELGRLLEDEVSVRCTEAYEGRVHAALAECLGRIDGPSRELLRRRYAEEASVRTLAAELQRGYSAVTMQLHRLRTLLAACIEGKLASMSPS